MPTAANKAAAPGWPGMALSHLADAPDCMHRLRLEAPRCVDFLHAERHRGCRAGATRRYDGRRLIPALTGEGHTQLSPTERSRVGNRPKRTDDGHTRQNY